MLALGHVGEPNQARLEPLAPGGRGREFALHLVVFANRASREIDRDHAARLQAATAHHLTGLELEHTSLARDHQQAVCRDLVSAGPQAVAVEQRDELAAVGRDHCGRPVPRLHHERVVLEKVAKLWAEAVLELPRLGHHHGERVRQAAAREHEQFEHLVEARRVAAAI